MSDTPFCTECGSVLPDVGEAQQARDEMIERLREDVSGLERDLRSKRAENKRLRGSRDKWLEGSPQYDDAMEVLELWKQLCHPSARELGGKRLEVVQTRLKSWSVDELKQAVRGYAARPYVVNGRRTRHGTPDDRHDDAELIFRESKNVEKGIAFAKAEDSLGEVLTPAAPDSEVALSELGDRAVRYAEHGFYVFPVRAGGKEPVTRNGLHDAKREDLNAIRSFWTEHPEMNVAVRTGRESGIVVLDVDGEEGFDSLHDLEREHGELPATGSVTTPRGGQHFYWRHPGVEIRNTFGSPGPGLDIRGDGGYVLVPPSVVGSGCYELADEDPIADMPPWLLELLVNRQEAGRYRDDSQRVRDLTTPVLEGQRNGAMAREVGRLLNVYGNVEEPRVWAHTWNQQNLKPPLSAKEVDAVVDSIARRDAATACVS